MSRIMVWAELDWNKTTRRSCQSSVRLSPCAEFNVNFLNLCPVIIISTDFTGLS